MKSDDIEGLAVHVGVAPPPGQLLTHLYQRSVPVRRYLQEHPQGLIRLWRHHYRHFVLYDTGLFARDKGQRIP